LVCSTTMAPRARSLRAFEGRHIARYHDENESKGVSPDLALRHRMDPQGPVGPSHRLPEPATPSPSSSSRAKAAQNRARAWARGDDEPAWNEERGARDWCARGKRVAIFRTRTTGGYAETVAEILLGLIRRRLSASSTPRPRRGEDIADFATASER
jgi:hypothetical protein